MKVYFTSDQHFHHTNIIKYCDRPFKSIEEMNEKIVLLYNTIVLPEDTVYHLGDFSMAFRPVETFTPRLNGTKHLIMGNHDFCHPGHQKGKKNPEGWKQKYLDCGFTSVSLQDTMQINGQEVLLNHMPYKNLEAGEHGQKHMEHRPDDKGLWLLHGHVHTQWKVKGKMINVGVDQWDFKPVSLETLADIIGKIYGPT